MSDIEHTYDAIRSALDPKSRSSGRKLDFPFNGNTLKLVDYGSRWILRGPDGTELAKSLSSLKTVLKSLKGPSAPTTTTSPSADAVKIERAVALIQKKREELRDAERDLHALLEELEEFDDSPLSSSSSNKKQKTAGA